MDSFFAWYSWSKVLYILLLLFNQNEVVLFELKNWLIAKKKGKLIFLKFESNWTCGFWDVAAESFFALFLPICSSSTEFDNWAKLTKAYELCKLAWHVYSLLMF